MEREVISVGTPRGGVFPVHGGDVVSRDNNDTSNKQNQFDYKATVARTLCLGAARTLEMKERICTDNGSPRPDAKASLCWAAEEFYFFQAL